MDYVTAQANKLLQWGLQNGTGTSTCGPFSIDQGEDNTFSNICREHDLGYQAIISSGSNPYTTWNEYDALMLSRMNHVEYTLGIDVKGFGARQYLTWQTARQFLRLKRSIARQSNRSPDPFGKRSKMTDDLDVKMDPSQGDYQVTSLNPNLLTFRSQGGRKRTYYEQITANQLLRYLAPPVNIKGHAYHEITLDANVANYFTFGSNDGERICHGTRGRWYTVYKAAEQSVSVAPFDGNFESIWKYSATNWTFHNPNTVPVHMVLYEVVPKDGDQAASNGPLYWMDQDLNQTDRFPGPTVNINTDIPQLYTASTPPVFVDQFTTPTWFYPKHSGALFHDNWKIIRKTNYMLDPGAYGKWTQESQYGFIKGEQFDGSAGDTFISSLSRLLILRVEAGFTNAVNAPSTEAGVPQVNMVVKIDTTDVVHRGLPVTNTKYYYINNSAGGANEGVYRVPSGTTFESPMEYKQDTVDTGTL